MIAPASRFLPVPQLTGPIRLETGAKLPAPDDRTATTAKDFEATFLSLLLKEMRQTLEEGGGLFPGDAGDVQGGLFDLFLGKHLADAGGFGLAPAIDRQLRYIKNASPLPPPAGAGPARPSSS